MPIARQLGSSSLRTRCARRSNDVILPIWRSLGRRALTRINSDFMDGTISLCRTKPHCRPQGVFAMSSPLRLMSNAVPPALSILRKPVVFTDWNGTVQTYRSEDESVAIPPARVREIRIASSRQALANRWLPSCPRKYMVGLGNAFPRTLRPFPRDQRVTERDYHVSTSDVQPVVRWLFCVASHHRGR